MTNMKYPGYQVRPLPQPPQSITRRSVRLQLSEFEIRVLLTIVGSDNKSEPSNAPPAYIITRARKPHQPPQVSCASSTITVEQFPVGYPLQAAFQSSEPSFSIYRSFGYLHSRVILEVQDELRVLEDKLVILDERDSHNEDREDCVTSRLSDLEQARLDGVSSERASLLDKIYNKLMQYDEILLKAREMNGFQRPSNRDYKSLRNWCNIERPLSSEAEREFVRRKEDLITLRQGREWAGFDGWMETAIMKLPRCLSEVGRLFICSFGS